VFANVELDDCRAEDVAGVGVGQGHTRHDFHGLSVRYTLEPLDDELDVDQLEQRLRNLDLGVFEPGVARLLTLDPRTVAQHHVGDVAGGRRGVNRPRVTSPG